MAEPVIYASGLPRAEACILCDSAKALVNDHCHAHGFVRGTVCSSCNAVMARIDSGRITDDAVKRFGGIEPLQVHRLRCPDCLPQPVRIEKAGYKSAALTQATAQRLLMLTASMTVEKGSRVTTSELVDALMDLGQEEQGRLIAHLKGKQIHHRDGDPRNNDPGNLEVRDQPEASPRT